MNSATTGRESSESIKPIERAYAPRSCSLANLLVTVFLIIVLFPIVAILAVRIDLDDLAGLRVD